MTFRQGGATVVAVADGVGGRSGGERAAELAVARLRLGAARVTNVADPSAWVDLLADVDRDLHSDPAAGETTLVVVALSDCRLAGATVGDSEAWIVSDGGVRRLTSGGRRKPYLGYGAAGPFGFSSPPLGIATLLVATDGLFKYADESRICDAVRDADLEAAASRTAELVRNTAGTFYDDLALVLARDA